MSLGVCFMLKSNLATLVAGTNGRPSFENLDSRLVSYWQLHVVAIENDCNKTSMLARLLHKMKWFDIAIDDDRS